MTWTRLLGALTYWSKHHRAKKSLTFGVYPVLYAPTEQPRSPLPDSSITTKTASSGPSAETAADPIRTILQFDAAGPGKIEGLTDRHATPAELDA